MFSHEALDRDVERYLEIADKFHLLVTGGSDCHGFSKGKPLIGTVKLPYEHVEKCGETGESLKRSNRRPDANSTILRFTIHGLTNMGFFSKFKAGLQKTHSKLAHEIKRIVTRSPKLDAASLEELEAALIAADLGVAVTAQIVAAVKLAYETQGGAATGRVCHRPRRSGEGPLRRTNRFAQGRSGPTVVSIVGVNGTGKTTTAAKLAHSIQFAQKKPRCSPRATRFAPPPLNKSNCGASG
jgi:signal recognition particle GTPase